MADRNFLCFRHSDTTTNLEQARLQGQSSRIRDEGMPRFPIGGKPSYHP